MKKNKKQTIALTLLFSTMTIVPATLTSCHATTSNSSAKDDFFNNETEHKVSVEKYHCYELDWYGARTYKLNPIMKNALNIANTDFIDHFSSNIDALQKEFDISIVNFYNFYNQTFANGKCNGIKSVKVLEINEQLNVKLSINYTGKTIDGSYEKQKNIKLSPWLIDIHEIDYLTNWISNWEKESDYIANKFMDIFVGKNNDNKNSIFEQIQYLNKIHKYGGLLGFKLNIWDLNDSYYSWDEKVSLLPCVTINKYYVPRYDDSISKEQNINISADYHKTRKYSYSEILSIKNIEKNIETDISLNDILKEPIVLPSNFSTKVDITDTYYVYGEMNYFHCFLISVWIQDDVNKKSETIQTLINKEILNAK